MTEQLTCVELCAGAGGTALGLERAGFTHEALIEYIGVFCETLRNNRPAWKVTEGDVCELDGNDFRGIDLLSGGVPCTPFTHSGGQLGADDARDLFPEALRITEEARPRALFLENAAPLVTDDRFAGYRDGVLTKLSQLGYSTAWRTIDCADFDVPQRRVRSVLIALKDGSTFVWPQPSAERPPTVGEAIGDLMGARGWPGAAAWARNASTPAPTLVGGSERHGGADVGPSGSKRAWAALGVDGKGIADAAPDRDGTQLRGRGIRRPIAETGPMLTTEMGRRLMTFPDTWALAGGKTARWSQCGNALPVAAAEAIGLAIARALRTAS